MKRETLVEAINKHRRKQQKRRGGGMVRLVEKLKSPAKKSSKEVSKVFRRTRHEVG